MISSPPGSAIFVHTLCIKVLRNDTDVIHAPTVVIEPSARGRDRRHAGALVKKSGESMPFCRCVEASEYETEASEHEPVANLIVEQVARDDCQRPNRQQGEHQNWNPFWAFLDRHRHRRGVARRSRHLSSAGLATGASSGQRAR